MLLKLLSFLSILLCSSPAEAAVAPDSAGDKVMVAFKKDKDDGAEEDMTEEEKERAAEEERRKKEKMARVIVLRWKGTTTDYADETVKRNVRSRIDRPDALFFPEVDLYQNGRKLKDKTVVPAMQPALVPDANIEPVMQAVSEVASLPYNAMQPYQWGLKAQELAQLAETLWYIDRVELREPLFLLFVQIGRAAENQNNTTPPFFEQIGAFPVNYYWYMAAVLAQQEPALMSKVTDQDLVATIGYYLDQLQQGAFPTIKVDFELDDQWDAETFLETYEILFNGLPVEPDENAQVSVFLGRTDIYLRRQDTGHGLSERLEVTKLDDKFYPVVQNARKRMGIDFIDQLFLHPNECSPDLDGDILNYLSIYSKLHAKSDVYIAVPQDGNANKTWIWRYDRKTASLSLVGGGPDDFPVRFALLASVGVLYNGGSVAIDDDIGQNEAQNALDMDDSSLTNRVNSQMDAATLPVNVELRGHYNRLMVALGMEYGYNLGGSDSASWVEYYQTPGQPDAGTYVDSCHNEEVDSDNDGEADGTVEVCDYEDVYNERIFNRYLYFGSSVVLGRDAGLGFGPRIGFRFGWLNMPHSLQTTLDVGWSYEPPIWNTSGRVRPLVDMDLRGGVDIATNKSLQRDLAAQFPDDEHNVSPVFGFTGGIGLTF